MEQKYKSTFRKSGAKLVIAHLPKIFTNNFCSTFSKSGFSKSGFFKSGLVEIVHEHWQHKHIQFVRRSLID